MKSAAPTALRDALVTTTISGAPCFADSERIAERAI